MINPLHFVCPIRLLIIILTDSLMKSVISNLDFMLSAALCSSQFVFSVVRTIASAIDNHALPSSESSFDDFMCAFWFLALCGCVTKRRYIIVFTTMAMFYTFILSFKWSAAASYSYFTNTPLSCTREARQSYPNWCKNADLMFLAGSVVCIIITLAGSMLSALRLWSDEEDYENDESTRSALLSEESCRRRPMINAFKCSIDR